MKIIITIIFFLILFAKSFACDCNILLGHDSVDLVFMGKVIKIEKQDEYSKNKITFQVCKYYKGKMKKKKITVNVPCLADPCCGIDFKVGKKYEVYALEQNGIFTTDQCTMTMELKE